MKREILNALANRIAKFVGVGLSKRRCVLCAFFDLPYMMLSRVRQWVKIRVQR